MPPARTYTSHAQVRAALRDRRLRRPVVSFEGVFGEVERFSLLALEPPEHTRLRRLLAAWFTPRAVEGLREFARELAATLPLDGEFLTRYAQPFSLGVIARLLGLPPDPVLLEWSHAMVKMYESTPSALENKAAEQAASEFRDYLASRTVPGMTAAESVSTFIMLLNAGHEATVNTLGNSLWALEQHPAEWDRLGLPTAIDELLRWDPPLRMFEREVTVECEWGAPGDRLQLLFREANRDPAVFPDPDRLDLGRANASEQIGFGGGLHACLGAPLARVSLEAAFADLARRRPRVRQEPKRTDGFVLWGFEAVWLADGSRETGVGRRARA